MYPKPQRKYGLVQDAPSLRIFPLVFRTALKLSRGLPDGKLHRERVLVGSFRRPAQARVPRSVLPHAAPAPQTLPSPALRPAVPSCLATALMPGVAPPHWLCLQGPLVLSNPTQGPASPRGPSLLAEAGLSPSRPHAAPGSDGRVDGEDTDCGPARRARVCPPTPDPRCPAQAVLPVIQTPKSMRLK